MLSTFVLAGSALARQGVRADQSAPVGSLRSLVDHYRTVTWIYERAAHVRRTPTSFSDRRSTDRAYLRWSIEAWTRHAYHARQLALASIQRRLAVRLPEAPTLHAQLSERVSYSRKLTLSLRRIYPGRVTRRFASATAGNGRETLRLWQARSALAAAAVALHGASRPPIPGFLGDAFACIHHFEGAWTSNTGNGYYGGLQMDLTFQSLYGGEFVRRWGTADNWPAWAQLQTAVRAYESGRGFGPWPNTARACGLI